MGDCREPLGAGAERVPWWELVALASHCHPSVAAMARSLLAAAPVVYDGDPLRDLSLTAFLDSFVQRKPKVWHGQPAMLEAHTPSFPCTSVVSLLHTHTILPTGNSGQFCVRMCSPGMPMAWLKARLAAGRAFRMCPAQIVRCCWDL